MFSSNRAAQGRREMLRRDLAAFANLRVLTLAAVLAAMSLILGKFLQIPTPFRDFLRFSFENLPILFAGVTMGPFVGLAVGVVADLLGCLLYGYAINPIITLGAAAVGLLSGLSAHYLVRRPLLLQLALAGTLAHLVGSVLIKSAGRAAWYLGQYQLGLWQLMLWRLAVYLPTAAIEIALLYILLRRRSVAGQLERMLDL